MRPKQIEDGAMQVNCRLPQTLVERLDRLAEQQKRSQPMRTYSRSDLMRELLAEGVERREAAAKKTSKGAVGS